MMSLMYCRCQEHTPCSRAVCINPQQMVAVCFHPWASQVQVYWIFLHVKQTVSCTKGSQLSYSLSFLTCSSILGAFPAHCHLAVGVWCQYISWKFHTWTVCTKFHPGLWMSDHYRSPMSTADFLRSWMSPSMCVHFLWDFARLSLRKTVPAKDWDSLL